MASLQQEVTKFIAGLIVGLTTGKDSNALSNVPIVGPFIDTLTATAEAIETFAQLFVYSLTPVTVDKIVGDKVIKEASILGAFKMWASIPLLQLAVILGIGAPTAVAVGYTAPRMIVAIPNAMQTLADIDFKLSEKQKKILKYSALGVGGAMTVGVARHLSFFQFLERNDLESITAAELIAAKKQQEDEKGTFRLEPVKVLP